MKVAAIDVGTNSTRLLIAEWDGAALERLHAESHVTRLGRGVDATGRLDGEGIRSTIAWLAQYQGRVAREGVERVVAVATSAARDAANVGEFIEQAAAVGMRVRVLSGDEEARYSFAGATLGRGAGEQMVIDAGGGSTELVAGHDGELRLVRSIDVGCVRLTERHLKHDPPTQDELAAVAAEAGAAFGPVLADIGAVPEEAVAVGGTATTLAAIQLGLVDYDDAQVDCTPLDRAQMQGLRDRLAAMTVAQIADMPIVQPGRADVLVAGAALLLAIMEVLGLRRYVVRDRDILDGLALQAAGE